MQIHPTGLEPHLKRAAHALREDLLASATAKLRLPGSLPQRGVLGVSASHLFVAWDKGFDQIETRQWPREQLGPTSVRPTIDGQTLTIPLPKARLLAEELGDDAKALLHQLQPTAPPGASTETEQPRPAEANLGPEDIEPTALDLEVSLPSQSGEGPPPSAVNPQTRIRVAIAAMLLMFGVSASIAFLFVSTDAVSTDAVSTDAVSTDAVSTDAPQMVPEVPPATRAPHGLKGLEFGMTLGQAQLALPALAEATPLPPETLRATTDLLDLSNLPPQGKVPGPRLSVHTRIGPLHSTCALSFAVRDTLSQMDCTIDDLDSEQTHLAALRILTDILTDKYGAPARTGAEEPLEDELTGFSQRASTTTWSDDQAQLVLQSELTRLAGMTTATIELINTSSAHTRLLAQLQAQLDQEAAQAAERRARQEATQGAQIEAGREGLGRDL